jgi:predicted TPR repeat methyltransferase
MPIGCYSIIPYVANHLVQHRPRRVLDLGIGFGMYGAVVRQWLDLGVKPWSTYLVGVEAWADYGNPLWDLYDLVAVDSIENFVVRQTQVFDCVLFNDVLEHFAKDVGRQVLDRVCKTVAPGGTLAVGTPAVPAEQGAVHGNEFERHRSAWTASELSELGFEIILDGRPGPHGMRMILGIWRNREDG